MLWSSAGSKISRSGKDFFLIETFNHPLSSNRLYAIDLGINPYSNVHASIASIRLAWLSRAFL
jgi:hypothetical protein